MLGTWEWETLVSSWRYLSGDNTREAMLFPYEIVKRYWVNGGKHGFTDNDRNMIAHQFTETDHRKGGFEYRRIFDASVNGKDGNLLEMRKLWTFLHKFQSGECPQIEEIWNTPLDDDDFSWEWTTLLSSWRYFHGRGTIAASMFPGEIVERYWTNGKKNMFTDDDRRKLSHLFVDIDYTEGSKHFNSVFHPDPNDSMNNFAEMRMLWSFLHGYLNGYHRIVASNGKITEEVNAFIVDDVWRPVDGYIKNPIHPPFIPVEYIKSIDGVKQKNKRRTRNGKNKQASV